MIRFFANARSHTPLSRREWLRLGGLAGLGLGLRGTGDSTGLVAAEQRSASKTPGFGKAKSVILIFANGGQSQLETWDPKPKAPEQVRGAFAAIDTAVSGVQVSEHMPRLARLADRYTIVRSMTHDDLDHGSAAYLALTGQFHSRKSSNPSVSPGDFPTYGAVLKRVRETDRFPYTAVHVNAPAIVPELIAPGQFGGFLGRSYEPLIVGDVSESDLALPSLTPRADVPPHRVAARRGLMQTIDQAYRELDPKMETMGMLYDKAFQVLASPACRRAFQLADEPTRVRDRYGRYRSGQACLLARRLVEAGVPLVTEMFNHTNRGQDKHPDDIEYYGWDTHNDIFSALKNRLLPRFDLSFSALLEDLDERGLLDETLVVMMGEFGRAPRVALEPKFAGSSPGRKHWASVYSIVMAGAGVQRGTTYGASDRFAGYVEENAVTPGDLTATLFSALGVDPTGHYRDHSDQPVPIATGRPITGLYSG